MSKEQEKERADQADLCNRLTKIVQDHPLEKLLFDNPPEFSDGLVATNMMYGMGFQQSLVIGLMGAFFFRQTRQIGFALMQRKNISWRSPTAKLFRTAHQKWQLETSLAKNRGIREDKPRNFFPARFFVLIADLCVGACVAYGVLTRYYAPTLVDKIASTVARWPLIEGRSKVAESLCDDVVEEIQRSSDLLHDGVKDPRLWLFVVFAGNCERRRAYEHHLRLRQPKLEISSAFQVPPPGVPNNFPVKGGAADQRFRNDSGFFPNDPDWWAQSYTNDLEKARKIEKWWGKI